MVNTCLFGAALCVLMRILIICNRAFLATGVPFSLCYELMALDYSCMACPHLAFFLYADSHK